MTGHRILTDKGTDRPILMSPVRLQRPRNTGAESGDDDCPFCEGHEAQTTKEADAVRAPGSAPDTPGWRVRAFPNLYPAAAHHEVIAEGPLHTTHPAELSASDLADANTVYRRRMQALEDLPDVRCAFLFKNVGAAAGSSIAHNHSQLLGLPMIPPRLVAELRASAEHGCIHCDEIARAAAEQRVVWQGPHHVILCPSTPKLPFETWLLPLEHGDDFMRDAHDADLASAMQTWYSALARAFDSGPFNSYLHRIPGADFHWHFEAQPRVGQVAALELGGDMYINAVTAQHSARHWREALEADGV